jgi:hypothetical protein
VDAFRQVFIIYCPLISKIHSFTHVFPKKFIPMLIIGGEQMNRRLLTIGGDKQKCPYYHYFATTYINTHSPQDPSSYPSPSARLKEYCEHPNSSYPRNGTFEKLPCEGNLGKCNISTEKRN